MLFIRSQKGFSLIEAVVGMVLLAILVGAILSVTLGDKTSARKNLTFNASCKAEAQRLISEFKSKGLVRDHYSFPPAPAGPGYGCPEERRQRSRPPAAPRAARAGKNEEAAASMRSIYPDKPPQGDLALEYYRIIGNTPKGWNEAREGLEKLVKAAPNDTRAAPNDR